MKEPTRILIVVDKADEADLAAREIRKVLGACEFRVVNTHATFLEALESFQPDVILSDYSLPHFDGMEALQLTLKHAPLTPLIIWTGPISEDVAVACIKAGANNYILKNHLHRLGPAVVHALEERELLLGRQLAEEKYRNIFDNAMEGIFQSLPEGRYLRLNPAMARLYGYRSPQEMIESIHDIASQIYVEPAQRSTFIDRLDSEDSVENFEARNYRKDGSIIWTSTSARAVRDPADNILYYEGFIQDITQRKNAEETLHNSEQRFRALIENGLDDISLIDAEGRLLWESPSTVRNLGYPPNAFVGRDIFELMHPDDLEWTRQAYARLLEQPGSRQSGIFRLRRSDGAWRWMEAIVTNMLGEPGVNALVVNYRDISDRKEAEDALRAREQELRTITEDMTELLCRFQPDGTLTYVNDAYCRYYGKRPEELIGTSFIATSSGDFPQKLTEHFKTFSPDRPIQTFEQYDVLPDGARRWREWTDRGFFDKDGNLTEVQSTGRDISARKQAEEALRESQARYRNLVETSHDLIWSVDAEARITFVNQAARTIYGYEPAELIGRSFFDLMDPSTFRPVEGMTFEQIIGEASSFHGVESRAIHRDGRQVILSANSVVLRDAHGKLTGVVGTSRDITAHKLAEDALKEERNLLRTLIDNIPDRIYAMDREGRKTLSNTADWKACGGKIMEEVIGKTDRDLYPPELAEEVWKLDQAVLDSGQPIINFEEPGLDEHGQPVSILSTKIPLRDDQGNVLGLVSIGRDITERKQTEARLNDLLAFNEQILNHSPIGILTYRFSGECVFPIGKDTFPASAGNVSLPMGTQPPSWEPTSAG